MLTMLGIAGGAVALGLLLNKLSGHLGSSRASAEIERFHCDKTGIPEEHRISKID
jgi:hypothetical protein